MDRRLASGRRPGGRSRRRRRVQDRGRLRVDGGRPSRPVPADDDAGTDARMLFEEGLRRFAEGDTRGAAAAWGAAVEIEPGLSEAWNGLGRVHEAEGRAEEAAASYRKAIAGRRDQRYLVRPLDRIQTLRERMAEIGVELPWEELWARSD